MRINFSVLPTHASMLCQKLCALEVLSREKCRTGYPGFSKIKGAEGIWCMAQEQLPHNQCCLPKLKIVIFIFVLAFKGFLISLG